MRRFVLIALATQLAACGPSLGWSWAPQASLRAPAPVAHPDADAVYLLRQEKILLVSRWRSPSYMEIQRHDIVAILTEKGKGWANVRVPYHGDGEIVAFAARTVSPDGVAKTVEPSRIFDDEALSNEDDPDRDVKIRVFTLPSVQPGCLIEYQLTIHQPTMTSWMSRWVAEPIPIERYRLSIEGTKDIRYSIKNYNRTEQWKVHSRAKTWRLELSLDDVPATVTDEAYAAPREMRDPWWFFRVTQFVKYNVVADRHRTWGTTMRWRADDLYFDNEAYYEAFEPAVDDAKCRSKRCNIEQALAYLRKELPFRGFGDWDGREAKKVVGAGEASAGEKSRLLWKILTDRGIESKFAFTNRYLTHTDLAFPVSAGLDHVLLWVPEQEGLPDGVWIDPGCEYCALGELPPWLRDAEAVVLDASKPLGSRRVRVEAPVRRIEGVLRDDEVLRRTHHLAVAPDGATKFELTFTSNGRSAQNDRSNKRGWTQSSWKKSTDKSMTRRVSSARKLGFTELDVDPRIQSARYSIEFADDEFATLDDTELLVPLSFVHSSWDDLFDDEEARKTDLAFRYAYRDEDVSVVTPPPGYVPLRWPEPVRVVSPCVEVTISAEAEGRSIRVVRSLRAKPGIHPKAGLEAAKVALEAFSALRQQYVAFRLEGGG